VYDSITCTEGTIYITLKHRLYHIQWNLEISDTLSNWNFVYYSDGTVWNVLSKNVRYLEVSVRRGFTVHTYRRLRRRARFKVVSSWRPRMFLECWTRRRNSNGFLTVYRLSSGSMDIWKSKYVGYALKQNTVAISVRYKHCLGLYVESTEIIYI